MKQENQESENMSSAELTPTEEKSNNKSIKSMLKIPVSLLTKSSTLTSAVKIPRFMKGWNPFGKSDKETATPDQ